MIQAIVMLALAAANCGMTQRIVEPMLPQLADEFSTSVSAAAIIITSFAFASAAAQYLYGPLGHRYGALRTVTVLCALSALSSFGCAAANSLEAMAAWRFACGVFASGSMTLGMTYVADVVAPERRQFMLARFLAGSVSGQTLGPFVGGALTDLLGWRSTFVVLGLIFLAVAAALFRTTRSAWGPHRPAERALLSPALYLDILKRPRARGVLFFVFCEMALFFGAYSFLGVLLRERFDLSFTLVGLIIAGFGVGGLIYSSLVRVLLARFGQRGCVLLGGTLGGSLYLAILVVPNWPLAMLCTVGMGFSFYAMHNTLQTKATEMAPQSRASALALFSMHWAAGQAVGALAMSLGAHWIGYPRMIALFGCSFILLGLAFRQRLNRL